MERLSNSERKFWKGPDFETLENSTILPRKIGRLFVSVRPQNLPSYSQHPFTSGVCISTRSRYAQLGLEVCDFNEFLKIRVISQKTDMYEMDIFEKKEEIAPSYEGILMDLLKTEMRSRYGDVSPLRTRNPQEFRIEVKNHSTRPIIIPPGSRLFRFYSLYGSKILNQELVSSVESGGIKIDGRFGEDWMWSLKRKGDREKIDGIIVRIKDENRRWIPPDPDNTPLSISDEGDYRGGLENFLEPIPQTDEKILWIGETPKITIRSSLDALVDWMVFQDKNGWNESSNIKCGTHINSYIIDGGTDWPVRVEVVSPTTPEKMPNFVLLRFFR